MSNEKKVEQQLVELLFTNQELDLRDTKYAISILIADDPNDPEGITEYYNITMIRLSNEHVSFVTENGVLHSIPRTMPFEIRVYNRTTAETAQ